MIYPLNFSQNPFVNFHSFIYFRVKIYEKLSSLLIIYNIVDDLLFIGMINYPSDPLSTSSIHLQHLYDF